MTSELITSLQAQGAQFVLSPDQIRDRLQNIHAFLFDWDGVFNDGAKVSDHGSHFTEPDSMGVNLLRLGYWLNHHKQMPVMGIITGAANTGVEYFIEREGMDVCVRGFTDKQVAWDFFLDAFDVQPAQVAFVFDDVLDLPIAKACGLRFFVPRRNGVVFNHYVREEALCDYISAHTGGNHAVREVCELMLHLNGQFEAAVACRVAYDKLYQEFLAARKSTVTKMLVPKAE